jgi:hypothetical protein
VSETKESTTRSPVLRALLQVVAAGGVGALALPFGLMYLVSAGMAGGGPGTLVIGVLFVVVVTGLLVAVALLTPEASSLTRTGGGRVGWALIVAVLGTSAWVFGLSVYTEVDRDLTDNAMMAFPLSGVPYALVAGLLLRRWYFKLGTIALVVASGIGLLAALAGIVPNEDPDLAARLAASNLHRDEVFVADIPGYHRVEFQLVWEPDDPQSVPPARYISLVAYPDDPTGDCQPNPNDDLAAGTCVVEQPGLTYTTGVTQHEYYYRKGTVLLQIVGTLAVDRAILRTAVLNARPTDEPGIYTTDIAGYEAQKQGMPVGMSFSFADRTQTPDAKNLELWASSVPHAGDCAAWATSPEQSPYLECVEENPGLHYERTANNHAYYAQHGSIEVRALGGLGVDRNLLRDAALSARPATDEELRTILPPVPPRERTFMDRLKGLAQSLFG